MLLREKPVLTSFLNAPLIYKAALRHGITPTTQQGLDITADKGNLVSFQFTAQHGDKIEKLTMYSEGPYKTAAFHTPLYRDSNEVYCNDVILNSKGKHTLHVLVNDNYAFTYMVQVK